MVEPAMRLQREAALRGAPPYKPDPQKPRVRHPTAVVAVANRGGFRNQIVAGGALGGGGVSAEAEGVAIGAHGFEAKFDVIFERDAEFFGAFADVVARDAAGECFVFHSLFHGIDFQIQNTF